MKKTVSLLYVSVIYIYKKKLPPPPNPKTVPTALKKKTKQICDYELFGCVRFPWTNLGRRLEQTNGTK